MKYLWRILFVLYGIIGMVSCVLSMAIALIISPFYYVVKYDNFMNIWTDKVDNITDRFDLFFKRRCK